MLSPVEMFTLLRIMLGVLFVVHGAHKLFGWFGGHGLHAHAYDLAAEGVRRSRRWVRIFSLFELIGGALLVAGGLTPLAAALVAVPQLVTIYRLHQAKGFWNARGGFEYSLVLVALALLIALVGPGPLALDNLIQYPWPYKTMLAASIVVAVLVSVGAAVSSSTRGRKWPTSRQTT